MDSILKGIRKGYYSVLDRLDWWFHHSVRNQRRDGNKKQPSRWSDLFGIQGKQRFCTSVLGPEQVSKAQHWRRVHTAVLALYTRPTHPRLCHVPKVCPGWEPKFSLGSHECFPRPMAFSFVPFPIVLHVCSHAGSVLLTQKADAWPLWYAVTMSGYWNSGISAHFFYFVPFFYTDWYLL